jgi:lysozyme
MSLSPMQPPKGKLASRIGVGAAAMLIATVGLYEGKSNKPYRDIVGVWTVCYGETRVAMRYYSDAECKQMLADGLDDYAGPVLKRNPELAGRDNQVVAATSLAYNIGVGNYNKSSVARLFSAGRWKDACNAFLAWRFAGGREVAGLKRRREAERAICMKGLT